MTTPREPSLESPRDPAIGFDPMERVSFSFGALLGVEDFEIEQYERILRRRIHQALLHGYGTALGLAVASQNNDDGRATELAIDPGWAIDARGRDIWVGVRQCLMVDRLHTHPVWATLAEEDGVRVAWIVARVLHVRHSRVPALNASVCAPSDEGLVYSRAADDVRFDLVAEPPMDSALPVAPEEGDLPRAAWASAIVEASEAQLDALRAVFEGPSDAPLLLARVELRETADLTEVLSVDNFVRPVLPPVQGLAEQLLGTSLRTRSVPDAFVVSDTSVTAEAAALQIRITANAAFRGDTIASALTAAHLGTAGPWSPIDVTAAWSLEDADHTLRIDVDTSAWTAGDRLRVALNVSSSTPPTDVDLRPLSGTVCGRTPSSISPQVCIDATWAP